MEHPFVVSFEEDSAAEKDLVSSDGKDRPYKCDFCDKAFTRILFLKEHERRHTGERPYECSQCSKTFSRKRMLNQHMRTHTGEMPYRCEQCDRGFHSRSHWFYHKRTHMEKTFQCDLCDKSFHTAVLVERHKKTHVRRKTPAGSKLFQCGKCHKAFFTAAVLRDHLMVHYEDEEDLSCKYCKLEFFSKSDLALHYQTHEGETPLQVLMGEQCGEVVPHSVTPLEGRDQGLEGETHQTLNKETNGIKTEPDITPVRTTPSSNIKAAIRDIALSRINEPLEGTSSVDPEYRCDICSQNFPSETHLAGHKCMGESQQPVANSSHQCKACKAKFATAKEHQDHQCIVSFNCDKCDKVFLLGGDLVDHMKKKHIGERPYQCDLCDNAFKSRIHLKDHRRIHTGEKPFQCDLCPKVFSRKYSLVVHTKTHANTSERPYACQYCDKRFIIAKDLRGHESVHTGERKYQCPYCTKNYNRKWDLTNHLKTHVKERVRPFKCSLCPKSFELQGHLVDHQRVHTGEKKHQCDICGKSFSTNHAMVSHRVRHTGENHFQCDKCEKGFMRLRDLQLHKKVHGKPEPSKKEVKKEHICGHCDKVLPSSQELANHAEIHSAAPHPYQCIFCDQCFSTRSEMVYHRWKHTGENPFCAGCSTKLDGKPQTDEKTHNCTHCSKAFETPLGLKRHMRQHAKSNPFFCSECNSAFPTLLQLNKHSEIHSSDGKYDCPHCNLTFPSLPSLVEHVRVYVGEPPYKCIQCSETYMEPAQLIYHLHTHIQAKEFACDICSKMFTSTSDLFQHKKEHIESTTGGMYKKNPMEMLRSANLIYHSAPGSQPTSSDNSQASPLSPVPETKHPTGGGASVNHSDISGNISPIQNHHSAPNLNYSTSNSNGTDVVDAGNSRIKVEDVESGSVSDCGPGVESCPVNSQKVALHAEEEEMDVTNGVGEQGGDCASLALSSLPNLVKSEPIENESQADMETDCDGENSLGQGKENQKKFSDPKSVLQNNCSKQSFRPHVWVDLNGEKVLIKAELEDNENGC